MSRHHVPLYLNDNEKKMLDQLEKKRNYRRQEFFRGALKEAFEKEFYEQSSTHRIR